MKLEDISNLIHDNKSWFKKKWLPLFLSYLNENFMLKHMMEKKVALSTTNQINSHRESSGSDDRQSNFVHNNFKTIY